MEHFTEFSIAVIGALVSVLIAYLSARWAAETERRSMERLLTAERERIQLELGFERERLKAELKLEYSVETAIRELLSRVWAMRSFKAIKHHIRGFKDDELRQHLVRAGAVAFQAKDDTNEGREKWGLLTKNLHNLAEARVKEDKRPLLDYDGKVLPE